jgi:proprotein convertase subtilisin/kexin type 5
MSLSGGVCSCPSNTTFHATANTCIRNGLCAPGHFPVATGCSKCSSPCVECYGAANQCTACPVYMTRKFFDCTCKDGSYFDASRQTCIPCSPSCAKCEGSAETCTECNVVGMFEREKIEQPTGTAVTAPMNIFKCECINGHEMKYTGTVGACARKFTPTTGCGPANQFKNPAGTCTNCDFRCATCFGDEMNCTTCKTSIGVVAFPMQSGYVRCDCPKGTFFNVGTSACVVCDDKCDGCSAVTNTKCIRCRPGLYNNSGSCDCRPGTTWVAALKRCDTVLAVPDCGLYHYWNAALAICDKCHPTCAECNGYSAT